MVMQAENEFEIEIILKVSGQGNWFRYLSKAETCSYLAR